jgi:hypothetical protein
LIRAFNRLEVNVIFLHCYPFHRDAAYLASVFGNVYFDVGSALHYHGPSSAGLLAEAMEVAPFSKLLYSSDAFGLPEQYHLGALLFRRALVEVLERWIDADHCEPETAGRIAEGIARGNASRIYPLPERRAASEQLEVLLALPVRDPVGEPRELVAPHGRVDLQELLTEELLRGRLARQLAERLGQR